MFGLRGFEWIIILVIALLIFGPTKLPQLADAIGKTIRRFRKGMEEDEEAESGEQGAAKED